MAGHTGPMGTATAPTFNPSQTASYQPGQMVIGPDGNIYTVSKANPSGAPGSSPDYKPLTGAPGPTGPTGIAAPAGAYDPTKASSYQPGQMIIGSDGTIYTVNKANPSGTPGSSSDYTAIASPGRGARDVGSTVPQYNPIDAQSYVPGQLVVYNGQLYQVIKAGPSGTPNTSPDYINLSGTGKTGATGPCCTGPTGPTGIASAPTFNPSQTVSYQPGQMVIGPDGNIYTVSKANPSGAPGSSQDYKPLAGAPGPTGPQGLQGQPGPSGPQGQQQVQIEQYFHARPHRRQRQSGRPVLKKQL